MSYSADSSPLTEAERNLLATTDRPPLYKFVFTGGPCGGKTTALARVFSYLRERNFEVVNCPEAFGILNSNGMSYDFFSTEGMARIVQGSVMDLQMTLEDSVETVLKARGKPAVILCDRGLMDGSVYSSPSDWQKLMDERNTDTVQLRDNRYDACFHMVTAADGAEAYYTLENNKVRTESKEDAIKVDLWTQKAWLGHPHLYVLDNSSDFEGKMSRLVDIVSKIVGLPSNLKRRSAKFLLNSRPDYSDFPPEIEYQAFEVEKVYLANSTNTDNTVNNKDDYSFIRRRSNVDSVTHKVLGSVYQITSVKRASNGELIEQKRIVTAREYAAAYETRDPQRHVVRQKRVSFLYEQQSMSVHMYEAPIVANSVSILHAQVEAGVQAKLPPFLDVDRLLERTKEDEEAYGAYSLSLIR